MTLKSMASAAVLAVLLGASALANVSGAIYTSVVDGNVVNKNIYSDKNDVYLNGGPQNEQAAGLAPDGRYYFQITDPSGAVLLSQDAIECRVLVVANGRIAGIDPAASCSHPVGVFNAANGTLPVQMMPFADTPNPGGEYKAWVTPVSAYDPARCNDGRRHGAHGFCDADSKTDNFKVRTSAAPEAAYLSVCKFNDVNGDGLQAADEPLIPHWPITATGVDGGIVEGQTGDDGCVTFTVTDFAGAASRRVVLSEGSFGPDWVQTAPGTGTIAVDLTPGAEVDAPNFGNHNPFCGASCSGTNLVLSAQALPSLSRTYAWDIAKSADQTTVKTSSTQATVSYTVTVTHDSGVDADWAVTGDITVANPTGEPIALQLAADAAGALCTIAGGATATIDAGSHDTLAYSCVFASAPAAGAVTLTASYGTATATTSPTFDFATAAVKVLEGEATIDDSLAGVLGTLSATEPGPFTFTYAKTLSGTPGACETTNNTATFKTATTTGAASRPVEVCVGAALSISKTATASQATAMAKSAARTMIQQQGGTPTLNYTVSVTQSGWAVTGTITVSNPNTWQSVSTSIVDAIDNGGSCIITGGGAVSLAPASSVELSYTCAFATAPPAAGTNRATAAWDAAQAYTAAASAQADAAYAFAAQVVTDTFNNTTPVTLGTIDTPKALTTFTYAKTVANAAPGACRAYDNTAAIAGGAQASQQVTVCNTLTGARTIGFWQNKNGQAIITAGATTAGVCNSGMFLRGFAPFADLSPTATCRTVAGYATTLIKAASAAGVSMNAMLKAQMLASALDVYFSSPASGNPLASPVPGGIGTVRLSLAGASSAFGGATTLTVLEALQFQNNASNGGGSVWYGNLKATQEQAKNTFDAINNEVAAIAP